MGWRHGLVLGGGWLWAACAGAAMVEEVLQLPVRVQTAAGQAVQGRIHVTLFRDDAWPATRRVPLALLAHGRAPSAQARADMGRVRYAGAARYLLQRGYMVAVPTRLGYGVTGGDDLEAAGRCDAARYTPVFDVAAQQLQATLDALRQRPEVRPDGMLVLGQSFGGASAVALAAKQPPGLAAVVNFSGGSGGDSQKRPGAPCAPQALQATFAHYGSTARVPMLWLYAENDQFWGPEWPCQWHQAFVAAGGQARLQVLGALGEDGHQLFSKFGRLWHPLVSQFLNAQRPPRAGNAQSLRQVGERASAKGGA